MFTSSDFPVSGELTGKVLPAAAQGVNLLVVREAYRSQGVQTG